MKQSRWLIGIMFYAALSHGAYVYSMEEASDRDSTSGPRRFHDYVASRVKDLGSAISSPIPIDALSYCEKKYHTNKPLLKTDSFGLSLNDYHNLYKVAHGKKGGKTLRRILKRVPYKSIAIRTDSGRFTALLREKEIIVKILMDEHHEFLSRYKRNWPITFLQEKRFKALRKYENYPFFINDPI